MGLGELLVLSVLGGTGALARFALDGLVGERVSGAFPYGTLVVNVVGCVCLGLLTGAALGGTVGQVVDTGLVGAFTTFSTWMVDTHRLAEDNRLPMAVVNLVLSLVLGGAGVCAGYALGTRL